jgi:hypothetical protein
MKARRGKVMVVALALCAALCGALLAQPGLSRAQTADDVWSEPVLLSTNTVFSWFADITADRYGNLHVVWDSLMQRDQAAENGLPQMVIPIMYMRWDGRKWSVPNDIVAPLDLPIGQIYRVAAAAGPNSDQVYIIFNVDGAQYSVAPVASATTAAAWSPRSFITRNGTAVYMSDVAVDAQGRVHAIWDQLERLDDPNVPEKDRSYVSDLFYSRSEDGLIWTNPINLSNTPKGVTREQIEIDPAGTIWVSWDEGWDRLTEAGKQENGLVVYSKDGGQTWSDPINFDKPNKYNAQTALASDGKGHVLMVWRSVDKNSPYFSWSSDAGKTWTPAAEIPGIFTRGWEWTRFDAYDLVADSAGNMHFIMVGRKTIREGLGGEGESDGLYHLTWDGEGWSEPERIFAASNTAHPEYPKATIGLGNQLHVVWFVRDQEFTENAKFKIWYSRRRLAVPGLPIPPTPSPTPTHTLTPTPQPTATATPLALPGDARNADAQTLYTENDDVLVFLVSVLPGTVLVTAIVYGARIWQRWRAK